MSFFVWVGLVFLLPGVLSAQCSFTISPGSVSVPAGGGQGSVTINASAANCSRSVVSNVSWLTVTFGQTGTGSGSFGYTVDANTVGTPRTGTINAAGVAFTVNQAAANCTYTLQPVSAGVAASGGTGTFSVRTSCTWTATADDSWVTITSGGATGDGTVSYSVQQNTGSASRSTLIRVGTQAFTINQAGSTCTVTLTPSAVTLPAAGGPQNVAVATPIGCSWTATSANEWITITSGTAGTGSGSVGYVVAANQNAARTGSIRVLDKTLTVNQAAGPCNFTITPANVSVGAGASIGRVIVSGGAGCTWTAASNAVFLTVTSADTAAGLVNYSVAANPTAVQRTGTILIAGSLFTLTQAGATNQVTLSAVTNSASYTQGAVSPGEIVTLFGANMGPVSLARLELTADGQYLSTFLGGTRVFFDGVAASLVYSSATQVSAIVPYAVDGRAATRVEVEYQGARAPAATINVVPAVPAIFALDASGSGPGAILNQDFTVNSASNRASKGSVIQIFATGEGQTDPPGQDGKLAGVPLPAPKLPVRAFIGGIEAKVLYAGAAPGLVAGVLQVNAEVPAGVPAGAAVPVLIRLGGVESQAGITVAVGE